MRQWVSDCRFLAFRIPTHSMFLIYFQLLLLGATSLGWMYWLNQWTTDGAWRWHRSVVLFAAGFAAQILILQNLVYFDIPTKHSFALPAIIGFVGLWRLYGVYRGSIQFDASVRINCRWGAAIFFTVFTLQSVSAIREGPANYYGKGHIDHINYTYTSEFLKSEPFSTPVAAMQTQPWLVRPLQNKDLRIGQSVAQAYVASLSFVSAKESFAALCSFFLGLLALATFVVAQTFSISRGYSALAALWVALAPATTRIQLDGFLSQTAVLFVFPLIIVWARLAGESNRFRLATGAVLASYMLVSYTELFVIAIFLLGLLTIGLMITRSPRHIAVSAAVTGISLLLVPAYLPRAYRFVVSQYTVAASFSPGLEMLAPDGGTVYGWTKALIEIPLMPSPAERQANLAAGFVLIGLCCIGLTSRSRRQRLFAGAAALAPLVFLGILLSAQTLAKYPFMKISESFTVIWVVLAMRGISLIGVVVRRQWGELAPALLTVVPGVFLLFALYGFFGQHRLIAGRHTSLSLLYKKEFKETLKYVAAHPERSYIIRHPDGLAAGWIAYEGRGSRIYIVSRGLSDVPLTPGVFAFSTMPEALSPEGVTSITTEGYRDIPLSGDAVDLEVYNPQGQDGGGSATWYWLGDQLNVEFYRWAGETPKEFTLTFRAEPGPAHPAPVRTILISSLRTGQRESLRFAGLTKLSVPIVLVRGKNSFRIESVEPLEHLNKNPGDARKHMSRLFDFAVAQPKPIGADDPRISHLNSRNAIPLPMLAPHNPQGEDRAGDQTWYWIGKRMELEVIRTDQSARNLVFELSFGTDAGPANPDPKRKIRVRNLLDNRTTEYSFTGSGSPSVVFNAVPGSTRLAIEVVSPAEQTVLIPNDPRNHMVRAFDFKVKLVREDTPATLPVKKAPAKAPVLVGR